MMDGVMEAGTDWSAAAEAELDDVVELRRAIHADPEIGLHCDRTTAKLRAAITGLPLEIHTSKTTSGFVAILRGGRDTGRTVLLRGDMDALPMQEETGLPFASKVAGAMHACGHDAHSAMLVGAARALCARRDSLPGTVVFMFQPGEEGYHGARYMIEDGLLDIAKPEAARCTSRPMRRPGPSSAARVRCSPRPTRSTRRSAGVAAMPRCRTTRSTRSRWRARSSPRCRPSSRGACR
jgi:metal-dependent amidase/aminoacylase/carboxypeptidase family protein